MLPDMDPGGTLVGAGGSAIGAGTPPMGRRAVVAVRDDALRSAIRSLLVRVGVRSACVATAEGMAAACVGPVEVVVLDCGLDPQSAADGRGGLCRTIAGLPGMRYVPVVAFCPGADAADIDACASDGARACIATPFDAGSLLRALAPLLSLDAHGQIELIRMIDQDRGTAMPGRVGRS